MILIKRNIYHAAKNYHVGERHVDTNASNYWLTSGQLFTDTEGILVAIQDQVFPTRNYLKYIPQCRMTKVYMNVKIESIQQITFAKTEYKN